MKIEKLEPAFKDYLWGGVKLREVYGKKCAYEKVAESWELSTHPAGQSTICGGEFDGMTLGAYLEKAGPAALGANCGKFEHQIYRRERAAVHSGASQRCICPGGGG